MTKRKLLLTETEAADLLSIKPQTLAVWRCNGTNSLKFVRVGRAIRYRLDHLEEWIEQHTATSVAEARNQ